MNIEKLRLVLGIAICGALLAVTVWQGYTLEIRSRTLTAAINDQERARTALSATEEHLAELRVTCDQLQRTQLPQPLYEDALAWRSKAEGANTDETDHLAVGFFQTVVDEFPDDALAELSDQQIQRFIKRMAERAVVIKQEQIPVSDSITACDNAAALLGTIAEKYHMFTESGHLDYHAIEDSEREQEPYKRAFDAAKQKALMLLKAVPDPDGSLAAKVNKCGSNPLDDN